MIKALIHFRSRHAINEFLLQFLRHEYQINRVLRITLFSDDCVREKSEFELRLLNDV